MLCVKEDHVDKLITALSRAVVDYSVDIKLVRSELYRRIIGYGLPKHGQTELGHRVGLTQPAISQQVSGYWRKGIKKV